MSVTFVIVVKGGEETSSIPYTTFVDINAKGGDR